MLSARARISPRAPLPADRATAATQPNGQTGGGGGGAAGRIAVYDVSGSITLGAHAVLSPVLNIKSTNPATFAAKISSE